MSISFNQIPINILVPGQYIEIDNSQANQGLSAMPSKLLVIGQKLAAGTQPPLVPVRVTRNGQALQMFGNGSQLAHMLERLLNANGQVEVYAIAQVDNPAGSAAIGHILFTGPATEPGTIELYIGGRNVEVGVSAGDTAAVMAANTVAAIAASNPAMAVIAAVDGVVAAKVNLTAQHKGVEANYIDLRINRYPDEVLPSGVTMAFTPMTGGTANPNVNDVINAIGDYWYTDFALAYSDDANYTALEKELMNRFGPMKMLDGVMYSGMSNSLAGATTRAATRNSPLNYILPMYLSPTPPYEVAAVLAAVATFETHNDPARPLTTVPLPGVMAPDVSALFIQEEREQLLEAGLGTFTVDNDGTVLIERLVSTYKTDAEGNTDPSYRDITTIKTLSYLRYDTRVMAAQRFPRYKLADDGTPVSRGQNIVTPNVITAALISRFKQWEGQGLVEDIAQFKAGLIVQRNANDPNRVDALIPPNIINGLLVFAGQIQFLL